jgi:hypothetical protein
MTLYIQQLQQNTVANSIEQSKGRIENGNQEESREEVSKEEKVRADQAK